MNHIARQQQDIVDRELDNVSHRLAELAYSLDPDLDTEPDPTFTLDDLAVVRAAYRARKSTDARAAGH